MTWPILGVVHILKLHYLLLAQIRGHREKRGLEYRIKTTRRAAFRQGRDWRGNKYPSRAKDNKRLALILEFPNKQTIKYTKL